MPQKRSLLFYCFIICTSWIVSNHVTAQSVYNLNRRRDAFWHLFPITPRARQQHKYMNSRTPSVCCIIPQFTIKNSEISETPQKQPTLNRGALSIAYKARETSEFACNSNLLLTAVTLLCDFIIYARNINCVDMLICWRCLHKHYTCNWLLLLHLLHQTVNMIGAPGRSLKDVFHISNDVG